MADQDWHPENWRYAPGDLFDLSGKTAIVTGGASGLGRAIALGLGAHGADVVIGDVDLAGAREVADAVDGDARALEADVTDEGSLEALRAATVDAYGGYEVVLVLPGINVREPILDLDPADWGDVIDLNLTGTFLAAKVLGEHLVASGGGSLITMASALSLIGIERQGVYSASKGGVLQLTRVLAAEWAPDVRVNALAPGYMKTPLVRQVMSDREWYEAMREEHLLGRFGDPEEVVGPAVFLASPAASFVTGAVLSVDGGWTTH